jgi:uncharacterized damage-inducible protein DinB
VHSFYSGVLNGGIIQEVAVELELLSRLAAHNQWANQKILQACSEIESKGLKESGHGYDSVIGILKHLARSSTPFLNSLTAGIPAGSNPMNWMRSLKFVRGSIAII